MIERQCAICGKPLKGIFVPIKHNILASRWIERGLSISIQNDSLFTSADIGKFGATALGYPCLTEGCSACVCVECRPTLKAGKWKVGTPIPFVKIELQGGICPVCHGLFDMLEPEHPIIEHHEGYLLIAGQFSPEITFSDFDLEMHPMGVTIAIVELQAPIHICALCLSSSVERVYTREDHFQLKGLLSGEFKWTSKFPLCKFCGAIYSDERLDISPYQFKLKQELVNTHDVFEISFANPRYGELFLKENRVILQTLEELEKVTSKVHINPFAK